MKPTFVQRIRDPVHGLVTFGAGTEDHQNQTDQIAWRLLNTPEFQRLRRIRQLGFSDLVYPGATHSRLAHSIGVYHNARRLVQVIKRRELTYDKNRARVALLAALLHDIGHGPFSHVFEASAEAAGSPKSHEEWGAEIVLGDTQTNHILTEIDAQLPADISALLKEEIPKDIYATIVSSQFDADRLDYLQRDRLMTGVQFGRFDIDWLLDCLEIGTITVEEDETGDPVDVPCLYLNRKGIQVAEEYLLARFRLYRMVYMHKTTRGAEKVLGALLQGIAEEPPNESLSRSEPTLRYFSETPELGAYLDLDDSVVWGTLRKLSSLGNELARRLLERSLYKCVDVGVHQKDPNGNLHMRVKRKLNNDAELLGRILIDDANVMLYRWFGFEGPSALNKVLVKTDSGEEEPVDIVTVSSVIKAVRDSERIWRIYAPDEASLAGSQEILNSTLQEWKAR